MSKRNDNKKIERYTHFKDKNLHIQRDTKEELITELWKGLGRWGITLTILTIMVGAYYLVLHFLMLDDMFK